MAITMTDEEKIKKLEIAIKASKSRGDNCDMLEAGLSKLLSMQKKNIEPASEPKGKEPLDETATSKPTMEAEPIPTVNTTNVNRDIHLPTNSDSPTMKDYYYFNNMDSGIQFRIWKDRLRQKLLNFSLVENPRKKENKKTDVDFYIQGCLREIHVLIETQGREEFKESLRNRRYSLGSKRLQEKYGREISFGFRYHELKKEFGF